MSIFGQHRFDENYYLDLTDSLWRVVKFNKSGWDLLNEQPWPMFLRYSHMQPITIADKGTAQESTSTNL